MWIKANSFIGGYYLYTSGGNTADARRRAEKDARYAREKTLDGAERVGDKIDSAFDDAKNTMESRFKKSKAEVEREWNKEKKELGKQVEVSPTHLSSNHSTPVTSVTSSPDSGMEVGGRWYGAFGGFGGLGLRMNR